MKNYLELLNKVLTEGSIKKDRTGTGTMSLFGERLEFDLKKGFPMLTTKKLHMKSIVGELIWFIKGSIDVKYLQNNKITIWDEWVKEDNTIGPMYPMQWRNLTDTNGRHIDQLENVLNLIKTEPDSRRIIINSWNVSMLHEMVLAPCHALVQFYVDNGKLSCQLYQRSADLFLGVPYNIFSYALLTHMIARECNLEVDKFIHIFGDVHLYSNHKEQAILQLSREPRELPQIVLNPNKKKVVDFEIEDISITEYNPHPHIYAPVSV